MSSDPRISVIIPLYNKVNEVERALKSILNQTYQDFVIIVVGGRSTDGSEEILKKYTDNRIKFVQETGINVSQARNQGIRIANTELIAFLDADDVWYPDFLETIVHLYQKYPKAGIYATGRDYRLKSKVIWNHIPNYPIEYEGYLHSWFETYIKLKTSPIGPCSLAIPTYIFAKVGYFNENARIAEDLELWTRIALRYQIVYSAKPCACYSIVSTNKATKTFTMNNTNPVVEYLKKIPQDIINSRSDSKYIHKTIDYQNLVTAYYYLGGGNKMKAIECLKNIQSRNILCIIFSILSHFPTKISKSIILMHAKINDIKYVFYKRKVDGILEINK